MVCGHFKDFKKRTAADNVSRDKAFNIDKDPKYRVYQRELASMVYNFLIKRLQAVVSLILQINLLLNLCLKMSN